MHINSLFLLIHLKLYIISSIALPEVWLRGPLDDVPALLQPVAHALLQAREEVKELMTGFPQELLWQRVAGLASPGFHLQHLTGVLDRLLTYAKDQQLDDKQLLYLQQEGQHSDIAVALLVEVFNRQVNQAVGQLKSTDERSLTEIRTVGRAKLPSTVIGLLVHAAEHTQRHTGQLLVTVKVLLNQASSQKIS